MNKKTLIILISCLALSIVLIYAMYALSGKKSHEHQSFDRRILADAITGSNMLDIEFNSYYIAGGTRNYFWLGNLTGALHLLQSNITLRDTQHIVLDIKDMKKLSFRSFQVIVDSPRFFIADGFMPGIFRGNTTDWYAERLPRDTAFFDGIVPLSNSSFAMRALSITANQHVLAKESATDTPHVMEVQGLLEKQLDGVFCTDGMLHYNSELARLVYVYYYRNQYITMDTSLNLLYRGNTIDSISKVRIKIDSLASQNEVTMAAPPLHVNKHSCVSGNWLFVHSNLMARNEAPETFDKSAVIDVYDLRNSEYRFSFYLPDYKNRSVRELRAFGTTLVALYDHYVITFTLNPDYFPPNPPISETL